MILCLHWLFEAHKEHKCIHALFLLLFQEKTAGVCNRSRSVIIFDPTVPDRPRVTSIPYASIEEKRFLRKTARCVWIAAFGASGTASGSKRKKLWKFFFSLLHLHKMFFMKCPLFPSCLLRQIHLPARLLSER